MILMSEIGCTANKVDAMEISNPDAVRVIGETATRARMAHGV